MQVGSGRGRGARGDSLAAKCPRFSNHNQNQRILGLGGKKKMKEMLPRPICHQSLKDFAVKAPHCDIWRTRSVTQAIIKCVPQAFDHVCHLNIYTAIGLLFLLMSFHISTVRSLWVGSGCILPLLGLQHLNSICTSDAAASACSPALAASSRGWARGTV